jgi:dolichol kinase
LYNALGVLFTIILLSDDPMAAISVILIPALGDGLAAFAGTRYGRHRLPRNRNKTWEGTTGVECGAACAWIVLPMPETILIVISSAIIEALPLKVNDNIVLPAAVSLLFFRRFGDLLPVGCGLRLRDSCNRPESCRLSAIISVPRS